MRPPYARQWEAAGFRYGWGISHTVALGDMVMFYGQWQVILGFYDAMFLGMDWWNGSKAALQQTPEIDD